MPKKVRLEPEVVKDAGIEVAPAKKEVLATTVTLPGEIAADPDKSARVSSPVAGLIERVAFKEGSDVKKGDVLVVLRVPDLGRIRGALAAAYAKGKAARANADRLKGLSESKLASEQSYLDAKGEAEAHEAEAQSLSNQLAAMGGSAGEGKPFLLAIRAPVAGVVVARDAVVGQPVTTEQILASIADLSEVWFLGRTFEKDLGTLREGSAAEVELNAFPKDRFLGTLEFIGKQIDPAARTITARVRIPLAKGAIRLGLFGSARVIVQDERAQTPVLAVPRSAVIEVAGKTVVFVRQPDGDFELHVVVLGEASVGKVQIVSGLREGEQVVVQGAFTLKSAVLKATMKDED